jgi:hypothetical protein
MHIRPLKPHHVFHQQPLRLLLHVLQLLQQVQEAAAACISTP